MADESGIQEPKEFRLVLIFPREVLPYLVTYLIPVRQYAVAMSTAKYPARAHAAKVISELIKLLPPNSHTEVNTRP